MELCYGDATCMPYRERLAAVGDRGDSGRQVMTRSVVQGWRALKGITTGGSLSPHLEDGGLIAVSVFPRKPAWTRDMLLSLAPSKCVMRMLLAWWLAEPTFRTRLEVVDSYTDFMRMGLRSWKSRQCPKRFLPICASKPPTV